MSLPAGRLPSLGGLRAFEAAARHLSFTKAADELHVTQAAISHQIRELEEELGLKLFVRLNRALRLSEAGELLLPHVRDGFGQLRRGVGRLREIGDGGVLKVTAPPSFGRATCPSRPMRAACPALSMRHSPVVTTMSCCSPCPATPRRRWNAPRGTPPSR